MYARMSDACSSAASDCTEAESAGVKAVAQRTSFADVDESKSHLISELKEQNNAISFPQVIQSELARLESETTAAESEAVHTSDDWQSRNDADSEDAEGSSAVELFRQLWNWSVLAEFESRSTDSWFATRSWHS